MRTLEKASFAAVFLIAMTISPLVTTISSSVQARTLGKNVENVSPERRRPNPKPQLKDYVLVGTNGRSNSYTGDTDTKEAHGCIKKLNLPRPVGLSPAPFITPDGALRGGYLFVIPNELVPLSLPELLLIIFVINMVKPTRCYRLSHGRIPR
jgi:hypothetical protein